MAKTSSVCSVLANGHLAIVETSRPPNHDGHQTLVITHVLLGHARHGDVREFVRADAEQVAFERGRVKKYYALSEVGHSFAQFFAGRALNSDGPPLSVELKAHRGRPFPALTRGAGGLWHTI
jgi:hypothetical protein